MSEGRPVVDERVLTELRASVRGDTAFVRELVEAYLADSAELIEAIEAALANADADALVKPAHTLKSSSATLGAMSLSATARALEMAARSGTLDDEETGSAAERIRPEWEAAVAALRTWMDGAGSQ
jgi:HPt (histidine-containing phosphotransfer) domain-containing protein